VREYLQRLVGLSLLGYVPEHTLPILKGTGANGKSTFINAVVHALGSYAHTAEPTLFMTSFADAHAASPALVQLRGKRFVATVETEEGKKLASSLVKHITGGDSITARALHKMPITFKPSHSAFMATNYTPEVDGSDQALFRRLKIIPFDVVVPKEDRDPTLGKRLEEDADSVLSWAVEGLKSYMEQGLNEPTAISGATTEYQHESDAVGRFINEELEVGAGTVTVAELNHHLQEWQSDLDPKYKVTSQKLSRAFKELGVTRGALRIEGRPTKVWNGVKLKQ
jgi:putative DNA primase/helicase